MRIAIRSRVREWVVGMQSSDGGWGAFEPENTQYYLNNIPFSDHGALLDPPTADVSGRCLSMLSQLGETPLNSEPARRALDYMLRNRNRTAAGMAAGDELRVRHVDGTVLAERGRPDA